MFAIVCKEKKTFVTWIKSLFKWPSLHLHQNKWVDESTIPSLS